MKKFRSLLKVLVETAGKVNPTHRVFEQGPF